MFWYCYKVEGLLFELERFREFLFVFKKYKLFLIEKVKLLKYLILYFSMDFFIGKFWNYIKF